MKKYLLKDVKEFIRHSNLIEGVDDKQADKDAMEAWKFLIARSGILSIGAIKDVHRILMKNLNRRIAGKWRNCDVWIGGEKNKFISESVFEERLSDMIKEIGVSIDLKLNLKNKADKSLAESISHIEHITFESIHPFEDGNGRVGRLLYNWHRSRLNLPIDIIRLGEEQQKYYEWFN